MKKRVGLIIIIIGSLHVSLGLVKFFKPFLDMISNGLINTAGSTENSLAFWFTFPGLLFIFLGYVTNHVERNHLAVPKQFGWMLLASSTLGVAVLPISGFWIVFLPALLIVFNE